MINRTYRHLTTGNTYRVLFLGFLHCRDPRIDRKEVVIYRSTQVDEPELWVQPLEEFNDGRFVEVERS